MPPTLKPFITLLVIATLSLSLTAEDRKSDKIKLSTFAPVKDTEAQLKYFVEKIGKDLSDKDDFEEAHHKRISLDASTVAVLALTLGMHEEKNDLKQSASKLVELSNEIVYNAEEFDDAKKAHANLVAALKAKPKGEKLSWDEPVADMALLMQQVPIVNDALRRGVNDKRRFKRNAKKTAARAVTLAAIAHASMMDTTYCGGEEDEAEWQKICANMRDACADVYKALMKQDQAKAKEGNARVVETCDACHHKFRD